MKKLLLCFAIAALFTGCSLFEDSHDMEKNADQLVSEGSSAFISKDYKTAVKSFTDLKDWYPFSKYAILAELKIADAHYHLEEYDEAIAAYEDFEKMHPKNEAIPHVIYYTGLCWFDQIGTIDRDHTPARNSLTQFNRLIAQYPESDSAQKAKANIKICRDNLSGHELYVADFYFKTKKYKAAAARYEYLVEHYPDSKESKIALNKLPRCRALANKK